MIRKIRIFGYIYHFFENRPVNVHSYVEWINGMCVCQELELRRVNVRVLSALRCPNVYVSGILRLNFTVT